MNSEILIKDYWYNLPDHRIALHPLETRDQSKLLIYKNQSITHDKFYNIVNYIPENATLFFNDTKVIPARLLFQKDTGASIEIFLLHPIQPSNLVQLAMEARGKAQWSCTIGNLKRWANGILLVKKVGELEIKAQLIDRERGIVEFNWNDDLTFADIVTKTGVTPLPPYLKREVVESDKIRYQTVYSQQEGAVAAPTAGLHFTENVLNDLKSKKHQLEFLTLHVSAGTFQPVKVENAIEHEMHSEQIIISRNNLKAMLNNQFTVAIGTTSMRTLESIYWYGATLNENPNAPFLINQHTAYQFKNQISLNASIEAILAKMDREETDQLVGETSIYIYPGYQFKVVEALITNFHQPGSTLMLLIAAFVGQPWKEIYHAALTDNYRFLSYGDSSLLFRG